MASDPNPVTDLEVTMTSYKQFGLTWTPPSNEVQDCIHAYNLTVTSDDRGLVCTYSLWRGYYFNDNIYPCVTTICTNYTATIYVVSYPGISRSTSITFYTGPAKARRLQASNTTRTETYLTWKSPDTMACAKHFKLYHCAYDGPAEQDCVYQTKTFSLNRTSYKLGGLQPCKDNYIWLATVDKYGGENNVSIVVHTGDGRKCALTLCLSFTLFLAIRYRKHIMTFANPNQCWRAQSTTNPPKIRGLMSPVNKGYSVTVSWLAAESFNPHCHAGYRVCSSSDRDGSENCYFTSKTTLVVKELTPCTNYTIHVQTVDGELKQYSHFSAAFSLRVFTSQYQLHTP
ncbi:hypothetical protein PR048_027372 [Dryococelus australis]|uniref:Fibronectin type-III domain-containing protein n=1 Tax=Dryococelus australis TaxID=614101 RepID=A0ABQ9GFG0_9NEOP|nr:hypothetical protein PR048_027372 [Dryococelus australis]